MMFEIIYKVIESGNFELRDMLAKIDKRCVENQITEEQRDELFAMARGKADFSNSVDVMAKLQELEARIKAIEEAKENVPSEDTYAEFEVGKWYYAGDKISFNGKNYECVAPQGVVCVWNPNDYPTYWKEI